MKKLKVGSDFSGVGAFDQALNRIGIDYETVFACDMDKYARQTYILNYGEPKYYPENVYDRKIPVEPLDIYVSTPPCQSFSKEGSRNGEDDDRGVLFYNSRGFIKENNPRSFILENVRGLTNHDGGKTFKKWLDALRELDYKTHYSILNAKDYNVLQNRERVFIVGIRNDIDGVFEFPEKQILTRNIKEIYEENFCKSLFVNQEIIEKLDIKYTPTGITYRSNTKSGIDYANFYDTISLSFPTSKTRRGRVGRGLVNTLTTSCDYAVVLPSGLRKLTVRECCRFMDFPDTFKWDVSDSQAYKQAGNSICVEPLKLLIQNILKL